MFYANDRKLGKKEKETYKSFPLILFISREPNDKWGELSGIDAYDLNGGRVSNNWRVPIKAISYILGEDVESVIKVTKLCPIILSYRYPCSIPNNGNLINTTLLKSVIRNISDYSRHSSNIANELSDYKIGLIIDHSGVDLSTEGLTPPNMPTPIFLKTYFGKQGLGDKEVFTELNCKINTSHKTIIHNIWKDFLSKVDRTHT